MEQVDLVCVNHPKRSTRLRCASCDSPICLKCMRQSSVGTKCPDCAKVPLRAKRLGKPHHYLAGALAGTATAALLGAVITFSGGRFFGLLFPILAGYLVGAVVIKAASNQRHFGIQITAALATAAGLTVGPLLAGSQPAAVLSGYQLSSTILAAIFAGYIAGR